jgi:sugar phosphate isomerase/epimerase
MSYLRLSAIRTATASTAVMVLSLLATAGCGQPSEPPAPAPVTSSTPLLRNPIALQLYSLRDSFEAEGVAPTLEKVKAMGFSHVELFGPAEQAREQYKTELDRVGLTPVSIHVDFEALQKDPQRFIDAAKFFGIQYVGNAWFPHESPFDAADVERAAAAFNRIGQILRDAGLTFFYHVHGFEFVPKPGGGTLFDDLVAATDPDNVKFQLDIFWAHHAGADPAALLRQYPSRWVSTHLKDMREGTPQDLTGHAPDDSSVVLGTGVVDVKGVLEAARDTAVEWHIIEEEASTPEVNIPQSVAYIRGLETGK